MNQSPGDEEEIDLQGMSAQQIAELFSDNRHIDHPVGQQPPATPPTNEFPPIDQPPSPERPPEIPKNRPAEKEEKPSGAAEAIKDLPEFAPESSGWKEKISNRRELIRQQLAGVDPVPPKSGIVLQADPNDPFIKLLRPLPQSEILALSAEVAKDDTIFYQVEKERKNQFRAHNLAAFLAALAIVIFALAVGPQFVTETLTNAKIPGWVPVDWPQDIVSGALFVLGLMIPIAAGIALLDGFRWLLAAAGGSGLSLITRSFPGIICGPLALLLVSQGSVIAALLILLVYWATISVINLITDLSSSGKKYRRKNGS